MLKFCVQRKGAISVFLVLILVPVFLLGGLTTDAARIYTSKVVISDAGEMAMNAALAQYNGKLHDEYGLFVMDKDPESMKSDLQSFFDASLNGTGISGVSDYQKILDLVSEQFEAINLEGSQIYKTEVEKQQIVEYMKYRAPVCLTELVIDKIGELKDTKKKAEAMEAQMDFGEAMEDCQDSMEDAKKALDKLRDATASYPATEVIRQNLEATEQIYKIRLSRCLLMIAAISHYEESSGNDAESAAKSYVNAAAGVDMDHADSQSSFENYMACLYYFSSAEGLDDLIDEWKAEEPDENDSDYADWEEVMEELEELSEDYNQAKSRVSGYQMKLRDIAYNECIVPQTALLSGYWQQSKSAYELADDAYKKLADVKKKLEDAKKKWNTWSEKTEALGEKAEEMKKSVEDYGRFFDTGEGSQDMSNLELLMQDVQTDKLYFDEMKTILTKEKFFGRSIATVSAADQYSTYLNQADAVVSSDVAQYMYIEDLRGDYSSHYEHTAVSPSYAMKRISEEQQAFYKKLAEYCETTDAPEAETNKTEVNQKLTESSDAGSSAEDESGYPSYTWTMDSKMPSVILGLVVAENAESDMTSAGGNVNDKSGRKDAISKFKKSIKAASSFLNGLERLLADNLENLYVAEYAMQMLSYYTADKEDGNTISEDKVIGLSGYKLKEHKAYKAEVEYVLWGNPSSAVNIRNTVMTMFGIRLLLNSFFAFTNQRIVQVSHDMALVIAGSAPYLVPVVQVIIELGFAGVETADDIAKLKNGYGVTIIKKEEYWKTFATRGLGVGDNTKGLTFDYSEYLRVFLNLNMWDGKEVKKLARIADCIYVNTGYDMSKGYTMLAIEAKVKARTTFMRKVSEMGAGGWSDDSYQIQYQSLLGY